MSSVLRTSWQRGIINSQPYRGRIIDIDSKYLSDSDQNKVIPVLYGRDLLSTSMLFPPWNMQRKKNSSGGKGGGKGGGGGSETFFASILFAVCLGEVTNICSIYESDNLVYAASATGTLIETGTRIETDYGDLRFYKGTKDQNIDSAIRSVLVFKSNQPDVYFNYDVPDLRHICYAISDKWNLGSSTSHPNIRVEAFKACTKLKTSYVPQQDETETDWMIGYDYAPPVILYEMLKDFPAITKMFTNNTGGIQIDAQSFGKAAKDCCDEGIYISVCIDDSLTLADAVANILEYCDGVVYIENNLLKIRLPWKERLERNNVPHKHFTTDDLIEEPDVSYQADDWGITKLSFCDRALDYEETTEVLEHPYYEGVEGLDAKIEEFDRVFVKQRSVANVLTKRLSNIGVKPSIDLTLNVLNSSASSLKIGDLIKVTYDKFQGLNSFLFRVNSISDSSEGTEIQAVSECTEFFLFYDTDILFIEQEKYLSMDRSFPYLYPKILAQRTLGANETNAFQNQYGKAMYAFMFVSESYYAGRAKFIWRKIDSSEWHPDHPNTEIGIEPEYQQSGTLSRVLYDGVSWRIKVSLSVDEMQSVIDKNTNSGEKYYIVCSRYHSVNNVFIASCVPIIFQVSGVSSTTNEFVCNAVTGQFASFSVTTNDNSGSWVSKTFFVVSESELRNCSMYIEKLKDKNRFAAVVYDNEGHYEKTPGYAAIFYMKDNQSNILTHVLNRSNEDTDDVAEHTAMWTDGDCEQISAVELSSDEYPRLVWDSTEGKYYVQMEDVEAASDEHDYLPSLSVVEGVRAQCRQYQAIETTEVPETNGQHILIHEYNRDSLIYVTVKHSGNSLILPSLEGVAVGDSITIIVTADGVEDWTTLAITAQGSDILLSRANNNTTPIEGTTFNVATGITTRLYCVLKNANLKCWYVDTVSGTDIGFI